MGALVWLPFIRYFESYLICCICEWGECAYFKLAGKEPAVPGQPAVAKSVEEATSVDVDVLLSSLGDEDLERKEEISYITSFY